MEAPSADATGELESAPTAPQEPLADLRKIARVAQVLIVVYTLTQLGLWLTGGTRTTVFRMAVPLLLLATVGSAIAFLVWFRRCRENAEILAPGTQKYSPGLAVGAWFIPVAMWWIPRRVAADIVRASGVEGGTVLVNVWWGVWLVKTAGGLIAAWVTGQGGGYTVYDQVAGVIAAVLVVLLIQRITTAQASSPKAFLV
ncbi:DUF4328 domain-containing protein [Streptomyces rhizosphaerihabitans]|uniref:DUF4328 domain-containing protein n=1 Tax=Streptomyces rhizosphaerihabitans TaxID=1266770 RepID=UPI0021C02B33|nr:DUF4328 domain-containing protein [Streptomyces rhizosphaerihabitans]MCT9006128.1 DUF4328 domain-containing protein [Streptomyces rhizosphaerihabitans]